MTDEYDCGHRCCDVRDHPHHVHGLNPADCPPCWYADQPFDPLEAVREARRRLEEGRK